MNQENWQWETEDSILSILEYFQNKEIFITTYKAWRLYKTSIS